MRNKCLAFIEPLPDAAFRQAPRRPVAIPVRLSSSAMKPLRATVSNVSRMGCRLDVRCRFAPGAALLVTIPDLSPLSATIVWSRERQAGVRFSRPLGAAVLDRLIARYPVQPPREGPEPLASWQG